MRRSVLALAAASGVFALTAAGASVLTLTGPEDLAVSNAGSVDITQTQCADGWTITYTRANPGDPITAVTATDTAVTPAAACGSLTSATWAFADGLAVNGTWVSPAWTFDYSATVPIAPTAATGLRYSLTSNAAAIIGHLTIGGPAATDACPVVDIEAQTVVPLPDAGVNWSGCNLTDAPLNYAQVSGANLTGANLTGAHLGAANLIYTSLIGADLTGANVRGAMLTGVILTGATLTGADMTSSYLGDANLIDADLTSVDLTLVDLTSADLTGATLTGATLTDVTYANTTCPDGTNSDAHSGTCTGHLGL